MNRYDLQFLAEMRYHDALVLFREGRYSSAHYLAGYAIECALKACIAKDVNQFDFPDLNRVKKSYTHDLQGLLIVAKLSEQLKERSRSDRLLGRHWALISEWAPDARYNRNTDEATARDMLKAVGDDTSGVLPWLKNYW